MTGPPAYRVVPCGPAALLVEVSDAPAALSLAEHLRAGLGATDVVPGARTVLVDGAGRAAVEEALRRWDPATGTDPGPLVEVPVVYDGADLADVAEVWGCTLREVVERHTSLELVSAFCGFAPGFAYLKLSEGKLRFRNQEVLRGVNWDVQTGQRVGLVGNNGAGKTTQLRVLAEEEVLERALVAEVVRVHHTLEPLLEAGAVAQKDAVHPANESTVKGADRGSACNCMSLSNELRVDAWRADQRS